jgi:hypothetical protein
MTKPQQPEIARSGRSELDPSAVKTRRGGPTDATPPTGAIPEDNLPGHHPVHEQDKPQGPPPRPKPRGGTATKTRTAAQARQVDGQATATITDRRDDRRDDGRGDGRDVRDVEDASFRFRFGPRVGPAAYLFGVTPWTTKVDVEDGELRVRFGPWQLRTPIENIERAEVTGPYHWLKVAGPPHISLRDRGVTMATSTDKGVCIRFKEPVAALLPKGVLAHPALTVTVEEPERLVRTLTSR